MIQRNIRTKKILNYFLIEDNYQKEIILLKDDLEKVKPQSLLCIKDNFDYAIGYIPRTPIYNYG